MDGDGEERRWFECGEGGLSVEIVFEWKIGWIGDGLSREGSSWRDDLNCWTRVFKLEMVWMERWFEFGEREFEFGDVWIVVFKWRRLEWRWFE